MANEGFQYQALLPLGDDQTRYRCISTDGVSTIQALGETILKVEP
jgi:fumarate hydratase class I